MHFPTKIQHLPSFDHYVHHNLYEQTINKIVNELKKRIIGYGYFLLQKPLFS